MTRKFKTHYTREQARALLPDVRRWLVRLNELGPKLESEQERAQSLMGGGQDVGGPVVNDSLRTLAEITELIAEFQRRGILIKDLPRGLIDFPAMIGGREVFLCWEMGEDDIEFWHEIDAGYAGREPL